MSDNKPYPDSKSWDKEPASGELPRKVVYTLQFIGGFAVSLFILLTLAG